MREYTNVNDSITWKNQRNRAPIALKRFCKFLSKQDKLIHATDMIQNLLYVYVDSPNGADISRCILWSGIKDDKTFNTDIFMSDLYDGQLNIEIQPLSVIDNYVYIAYHKKDMRLDILESWVWDKNEDY